MVDRHKHYRSGSVDKIDPLSSHTSQRIANGLVFVHCTQKRVGSQLDIPRVVARAISNVVSLMILAKLTACHNIAAEASKDS